MAMEQVEWQPPTFSWASQNVAAMAALLHMLPAQSTGEVGKMYQWLRSILSTATM
jgi:hypothetical protein